MKRHIFEDISCLQKTTNSYGFRGPEFSENKNGIDFEFKLPSVSFNRSIGLFSNIHTTPEGEALNQEEFLSRKDEWLPSSDDGAFVSSLMEQVTEPGSFAGWISPPRIGIDNKTGDFEYVRLQ